MPSQARCEEATAELSRGHDAVVLFVNDCADAKVIETFAKCGIKYIAMRCAGYDRVDLQAVAKAGIRLCRVPTYSPTSVAEMAITLMLAINRCAL